MTESTLHIIRAVRAIPKGKVSSYRDIAIRAGLYNGARQVVRVLHALSRSQDLPWHRVIRADGRVALPEGGGREQQIALLRSEGVEVSDGGRVNLAHQWALCPRGPSTFAVTAAFTGPTPCGIGSSTRLRVRLSGGSGTD
ncbi:MAG: MGMT family protein [Spirochaetaceae bacterium]|jgi:methylated-DNA-protein-cysteine methyltransferase-like protein|nr:MGMT family protein [Spirochaetaceae bacterium]